MALRSRNGLISTSNNGRALSIAKELYERGDVYAANLILKSLHNKEGFVAHKWQRHPDLTFIWGKFEELTTNGSTIIKYTPVR